ncbi:MAG: cold shock domain-containing protein [Luminiphilus sp.]|nr:cold shock domain-containing protein [Luminiphilus sp.]MDG1460778.1 cold shock domain-containing protein [Luminiphilus sp.]
MSSHPQKFSLVGRLVINDLIAVVIYFVMAVFFPTHWIHLAGLILLAVICALLGDLNMPSPRAAKKQTNFQESSNEGSIKWFNATKGFGFIVGDDGAEVFVHYRNVEGLNKRSIKQGQRVAYSVRASDRGPQAEGVRAL